MHSYEYIFTAIIASAILTASSTIVSIMSQPSINISEEEQVKIAAQKIVTQLTLNPGNPPEWGSNIEISSEDLSAFGLAKYGEATRGAYVLDPDKVQRLDVNIPQHLYIPPNVAVKLLDLGVEYGLKLEFIPVLDVNISLQNGVGVSIAVSSDQTMLPIVNAKVTASLFYLHDGGIETDLKNGTTDINGNCGIEFDHIDSDAFLVIVVDYYGICVVKTYTLNCIRAYFIGNYLILNEQLTITGNKAYQVVVVKSDETYVIDYVQCNLTQISPLTYNMTYVEPSAIALLAVADDGPILVTAYKNVPSSYSSIPGGTLPFTTCMLERTVIIGGSLYTLRIYVWRVIL
jgi:hypothetical protein